MTEEMNPTKSLARFWNQRSIMHSTGNPRDVSNDTDLQDQMCVELLYYCFTHLCVTPVPNLPKRSKKEERGEEGGGTTEAAGGGDY